jgi:hypothetical protein
VRRLKAGTAPTSAILIDDSSAGFAKRLDITVTWTAGVASGSASAGTVQQIDAFPDGWYRIRCLAVGVVAANTNRYRVEPDITNGTGTVIAWGAQAENALFSTSYIPTTDAAATRAADVASISGSNYSSWANNNEGTIFSDSSIIASQIKTQGVWEFSGGAVLSSLRQPQLTANQFRAVIGGTFTGSPGTGASLTTGVTLAAVAYSGTAGRLQVGSVGADTTGSALDATSLSIGSLAGSTQLNGRIKRLTYWPARLPNETLQTITQ